MNLADVFIFLFSILGFVIVFVAYWLMAAALFPKFVARSAERFGSVPVKATLLGGVIGVPMVILGLKFSATAPGGLKVLALAVAIVPMLIALFGSAGLALRIGQGLPSARDESEPWRRTLRGSIVLALSFVLPFIGWFALMPFAFLGGFGVFLMGLFAGKPAVAPALVPPPVPMPAPAYPSTAPLES
ncbi:MAG TPA: hypothetical protein VGO11_00355 [Chthoniobacteraceae bacterium]|jgi:hypothetical protein|nr:hypothetical protein [Chthoniobacteraceae bacterium]